MVLFKSANELIIGPSVLKTQGQWSRVAATDEGILVLGYQITAQRRDMDSWE